MKGLGTRWRQWRERRAARWYGRMIVALTLSPQALEAVRKRLDEQEREEDR